MILKRIGSAYPDYAILSEESGASANTSPCVWIADPLDGTTNFAHGLPIFSVTMALLVNDMLEVGVTYDPIYDELYTAQRGQGAHLNGERLHVSAAPTLETLDSGPIDLATVSRPRAGCAVIVMEDTDRHLRLP